MDQNSNVGPRQFLWLILSLGCTVLVVLSSAIVAEDLGPNRVPAAWAAVIAGIVLFFIGYIEHYHARRRHNRSLEVVPRPPEGVDETPAQRDYRERVETERRNDRIQAGEDMYWAVCVMVIGGAFASYVGLICVFHLLGQSGAAAPVEAP
jgi:predicted membrane channel-forming protein YqfA (hemolysin III family)